MIHEAKLFVGRLRDVAFRMQHPKSLISRQEFDYLNDVMVGEPTPKREGVIYRLLHHNPPKPRLSESERRYLDEIM